MTSFPAPAELTDDVFETMRDKASMPARTIITLGILAGVYIGLAGLFSITVLAGASVLPFGVAQLLAGVVFTLGLAAVLVAGAELFTGNTLMIGACALGRIRGKEATAALVLAYVANLCGSLLLVVVALGADLHSSGDGKVGAALVELGTVKGEKTFIATVVSGILANLLVCLAVWLAASGKTTEGKLAGLLLPVTAFVALGLEHSVANMFLMPYAYLVSDMSSAITGYAVIANIIASTIGNVIGGGGLALAYASVAEKDV
ncbi:formate/nitrite transporter family protein [Agrobacterium sp. NPDC058088]|uniref:formate/nitrite transporter family protein n=1 Tax=Agrobacterium sp. NPDC058088 TaxID=3346335 RepID=UPI0036D7ED4B